MLQVQGLGVWHAESVASTTGGCGRRCAWLSVVLVCIVGVGDLRVQNFAPLGILLQHSKSNLGDASLQSAMPGFFNAG